jgi:hypothetical protein
MKNELQIITQDNEKFVPIKTICDQLGIAYQPQVERLKNDPIMGSTTTLRVSVGADGKNREMLCIPFKYAFMWLSKINPKNVEVEARPGLIAAQSKAYDLLWNTLIAYQEYVEYRSHIIEEKMVINKAYRIEFSSIKDRLKENESDINEALALTFDDYLTNSAQLQIDFNSGSEM